VGGAIKQKGIEAPNIENEMEDCEECTATLSFYVISDSDLSQVHMVVENLGATGDIPDEGGCDRHMTMSEDTSGRRCVGHETSPSRNRLMTTGGDTSDGRCEDHDMSPSSDRLMTTGGDTSREGRCEDNNMSPNSDRLMTTGGDISREGRCEDHDMSPSLDRLMMTGRDTSREGVRTMI
jgi:hypothetical protein